MNLDDTQIFVDGENLDFRYQEMLAAGHVPRPDNIHIKDCFVWNQRVLDKHVWSIKRLAYYTSVTGDDAYVRDVRAQIAATCFSCVMGHVAGTTIRTGQIMPFVRKKSGKSRKESVCDIAIAVDVMRSCYRDHAEIIWLFSGDGDFLQLLHEVVHSGKCAYLSALSSGQNDELRFVVDEFLPLDMHFFLTEEEVAEAKAVAEASVHPTESNVALAESGDKDGAPTGA